MDSESPSNLGRDQLLPARGRRRLAEHASSEQDAAIFITAAFTGLRASELRNLRRRSVDFADSLVRVERGYTEEGGEQLPKSYKVRSVPLMPQVAAVLSALQRKGADLQVKPDAGGGTRTRDTRIMIPAAFPAFTGDSGDVGRQIGLFLSGDVHVRTRR